MSSLHAEVETIHGFSTAPSNVAPATQVRSTLLVSSQRSLRDRGYFDRYRSLLAPNDAAELSAMVVGTWLPISVGVAHYQACEKLDLCEKDLVSIGYDVQTRLRSSILLNFAHAARGMGVTPMSVLSMSPKFWARAFVGSEIRVERLGPKDARFTIAGFPFAAFTYNRVTFRGILESIVAPFCRSVAARDAPECAGPASIGWRMYWV